MDEAVEIPLGGNQVWRPTDGGAPSNAPMTLADGLAFPRTPSPPRSCRRWARPVWPTWPRAMGVRENKLEEVPSLALGTSPVTLREMVTAYSTIANAGRYVEPILITSIEDRHGKVLQTFAARARAGHASAGCTNPAQRHARHHRPGTGSALRSRYGLQADLAGKTGTTQDNTDGWFIALHPRVVAGAWSEASTMGASPCAAITGARAPSALPMVGDFCSRPSAPTPWTAATGLWTKKPPVCWAMP